MWFDRAIGGLVAVVVGDPRVFDVDRDAFRRHGGPTVGEPDADDEVGFMAFDQFGDCAACAREGHGQAFDGEFRVAAPAFRNQFDGIPGGVARGAIERFEPGQQDAGVTTHACSLISGAQHTVSTVARVAGAQHIVLSLVE